MTTNCQVLPGLLRFSSRIIVLRELRVVAQRFANARERVTDKTQRKRKKDREGERYLLQDHQVLQVRIFLAALDNM